MYKSQWIKQNWHFWGLELMNRDLLRLWLSLCFKQAAIADRCCHINLKSGVVRAVRRIVVASFPYWWIVNQPAWAKTWQKIVGKKLRSPGTRPVTASKKKKKSKMDILGPRRWYDVLQSWKFSWAINLRIVRKFLEFMKINSLLLSIPGLRCTVKRSKLWKLKLMKR